jgi:hypothetical protein
MIDQITANAITAYKLEERKSRAMLGNAINLLRRAKAARASLAASVAASNVAELQEFYAYQLTVNDPEGQPGAPVAALNQIEAGIDQLYAMVDGINQAAIAATGSPVFPVE